MLRAGNWRCSRVVADSSFSRNCTKFGLLMDRRLFDRSAEYQPTCVQMQSVMSRYQFMTIVTGLLHIAGLTVDGFALTPETLTLFPNLKVMLLSLADSEEVIRANRDVL
jgi:hypothetical protein